MLKEAVYSHFCAQQNPSKCMAYVTTNPFLNLIKSLLKVQVVGTPDMKKMNTSRNSPVLTTKKIKRTHTPKPVTATISPAFPPLRPSSRNSPKPGPSNRTTESPIAVKVEETNFSDEENHPEHIVIPSDPNTIGGKLLNPYFLDIFEPFLQPLENCQ